MKALLNPTNYTTFDPSPNLECWLVDRTRSCQIICDYCNHGSPADEIPLSVVEKFAWEVSTNQIQLGCGWEPTIDPLVHETIAALRTNGAPILLQTNGIKRGPYDVDMYRVSLDTVDSELHAELRGGSSLEKILRNIKDYDDWYISCVVQPKTIPHLQDLCDYAMENGCSGISFRQKVDATSRMWVDQFNNLKLETGNMKVHYANSIKIIETHDKVEK